MEFKTKTQVSFSVNMETAGAIVPVSSTPSQEVWEEDLLTKGVDFECDGAEEVIVNRLSAQWLEPSEKEVEVAIAEFDETYPVIAETIKEREAFLEKRSKVMKGIRGQLKVAASSLLASLVVISGIGFASRAVSEYQVEQEQIELQAEQEAEALREAGKQWALDAAEYAGGAIPSMVWLDLVKASPEVKRAGLAHAEWMLAVDAISQKEFAHIEELANF
jgi:uncharacterized protein YukE